MNGLIREAVKAVLSKTCLVIALSAALSVAAEPAPAPQKDEAAARIAQAQAWLRKATQEAIATSLDMRSGDLLLHEIGEAQVKAGDLKAAKMTASTMKGWGAYKTWLLTDITIEENIRAGDFGAAKKAAGDSRNQLYASTALARVARRQAGAGDSDGSRVTFEMAKRSAREMLAEPKGDMHESDDPILKFIDQEFIAEVLGAAGDTEGSQRTFKEAKATVPSIPFVSQRGDALASIAGHQLKAGDKKGAIETLNEARGMVGGSEWAHSKLRILADIAALQSEAGDKDGCRKTVSEVKAGPKDIPEDDGTESSVAAAKADALAKIAQAQAKIGDVEESRNTVQEAKASVESLLNEESRASIIANIAQAQALAGDIDGAKATVADIFHFSKTYEAVKVAAQQQAHSGKLEGLEKWIESLATPEQKAQAYLGAALGLLPEQED